MTRLTEISSELLEKSSTTIIKVKIIIIILRPNTLSDAVVPADTQGFATDTQAYSVFLPDL